MPLKHIVTNQKVTSAKLQRAKELRREMTPAEKILWEELRANKLGAHFYPSVLTCTAPHLPWRAMPGNAVRCKCRTASRSPKYDNENLGSKLSN